MRYCLNFIKKTPPNGVVVSVIFGIENHRNPSHYDLHIENFNSDELKFSIEYQYENAAAIVKLIYGNRAIGTVPNQDLAPVHDVFFQNRKVVAASRFPFNPAPTNQGGPERAQNPTFILLFYHKRIQM